VEENKRIESQINFIIELEKLKTVLRQNKTLDSGRFENSAEHSWHLALMVMVLKEYSPNSSMDSDKVIKMLLIHDLVEIYAGDAFLYNEKDRESATAKEENAAEKLFSILPNDQKTQFVELRKEFEERETIESNFAAAIDALQPLINHYVTSEENFNPHNLVKSQIQEKKKIIGTVIPQLSEIVENFIEMSVRKGLYKEN